MQNCFLMTSRLKSHIILVLDRLQCVARVNCLVITNYPYSVPIITNYPGSFLVKTYLYYASAITNRVLCNYAYAGHPYYYTKRMLMSPHKYVIF